jgi:hypothetical protein
MDEEVQSACQGRGNCPDSVTDPAQPPPGHQRGWQTLRA